MQNILDQNLDMATALLAGEKLKELILPGSSQDEKGGALAGLMVQLKLELPFDRVVTIGTVIIPILLVTLVFTRNFAGESIHVFIVKDVPIDVCPLTAYDCMNVA